MTKPNYELAEIKAKELLNQIDATFPISVKAICDKLGLKIKDINNDNISGRMDRINNTIYINSKEAPVRQVFTLAHELGHYKLHDASDVLHRHSYYSTDPKELEANHFAACLLMPKEVFIKVFKAFNGNINKISGFFGVSRPAVAFRADEIAEIQNEYS